MHEPVTNFRLKKGKIAKDKIQMWINSRLTMQERAAGSVSAHTCSAGDCTPGSRAKRKDENFKDQPESNQDMKQEQALWKSTTAL